MRVGFVGLGKMGQQIVEKFLQGGHEVVAYDVNADAVAACVQKGATGASSREELVTMLGDNAVVWLMIPSDFVQAEFDAYINLLPAGSLLIDGGNTHYVQTIERAKAAQSKSITFIDVGTSGGVLGLKNGFSLMVGGSKDAYHHLEPLFKNLVHPHGGYAHMGESGAGHYVKMIHNGIEYALMQSYAEGYDLLKYGEFKGLDLKAISEVWQHGSIVKSDLNSLIHEILTENYELGGIEGYVADSGEGRWTLELAERAHVPMPALKEALNVRHASQNGYHTFATKLLAAMRNKFGGHAINK